MSDRQLFDVPLQPISGSRFQPTGFPDIGAAVFDRPVRGDDSSTNWEKALLVESAQSMANRLEGTAWDEVAQEPMAEMDGLPYVRVVAADGDYVTSSRTEAHRLASAFVKDAVLDDQPMLKVIGDRFDLREDRPLAASHIAGAVLALDPFALIHGVFFADSKWPGQPKVARALTGFVEAGDVRRADSGGVKKDDVRHSLREGAGGTAEGYGTVPFHRTEWTAAEITASFSLDLGQLRAYGLGDSASDLLAAIARWEIRSLLDAGLRLRTACDLEPAVDEIVDRDGQVLGSLDELTEQVRSGVDACQDLLGPGSALDVVWAAKDKK